MELKTIHSKIYEIRGQKVMLDFDLANLYGVQTKVLNQAAKRNHRRFPNDFMFRLTKREWEKLDIHENEVNNNRSQNVTGLQKHRSSAALPFVFTEQGVAMLSSILNSIKAIKVNIAIMRAFVFIRQYALSHKDLTQKLKDLETKYDRQFKDVYEAISFLLQKDKLESEQKSRKRIGFKTNKEN